MVYGTGWARSSSRTRRVTRLVEPVSAGGRILPPVVFHRQVGQASSLSGERSFAVRQSQASVARLAG